MAKPIRFGSTRRTFAWRGLFIAGLFSIGAALSSHAQESDWNQVIAQAKKEGIVVVYTTYLSPTTNIPIADAFEKKYGVRVQYLAARTTEMRERVRTEQVSGRFLGDVQHNSTNSTITAEKEDDSMQPLGFLPNAANLKDDARAQGDQYQYPIFTINFGFLVNTNLVKAGEEPKSWQDLLDPKWKGKILADDPRAAGGGRGAFQSTYTKFGRAYQEKLATQNLVMARDYGESERRLARGEYAIYIPFILSEFPTLAGLPVKYVLPAEGVHYGAYSVSILKNPPHPNAARLMADFYLGDEAQTIYAKAAHGIVAKSLKEKLPPDIEALANVATLVRPDPSRIDEMIGYAKEIYK